MKLRVQDLVKEGEDISSLPSILYRVMEMVDDPDSSLEDLGDTISGDIALTARLLKIVNSSFYGFSEKIETVSHALNVIGTDQLSSMVLASSVMSQFKDIPEEFVTMESFWCHGVACGLASRLIAKMKQETNGEGFYVAGMLHDVGSLIIYKKIPELAKEALTRCNNWGQPLAEAEREIMGFDHMDVGRALVEEWKLPKVLVETVAYHHHPMDAPEFKKEVAVVSVADYIAQGSSLGSSGEMGTPALDMEAWSFLGLPSKALATISTEMMRLFGETMQGFSE